MARNTLLLLTLALAPLSVAAEEAVLFRDVRIFDGVAAELTAGHLLVVGDTIDSISTSPIEAPPGATVIEGGGRVLSPGFIDLHAHLTLQLPKDRLFGAHPSVVGAVAGDAAEFYLRNGFTTVRDAGGTHPDLARAVESGLIVGPRIYPSGAIVSQTSGHGDFRPPGAPHPAIAGCGTAELGHGHSILADGPAQWLTAVRENLKHGATQIKIMGGGGVASDYDPIHTLQPSPEEIRAAVQAASDWGTYVMAHSYTAPAIERLVKNGVKVIEHGLLIDEATAKLCAEAGVVISTQVAIFRMGDLPGLSEENRRKLAEVRAGQDNLIRLIRKHSIKTGFGTDMVFGSYPMIGREFLARADYFTPAEILRQATSESAEVIRLAGPLNRHGNFGEIREGWVADLLLIEGNPLEDITLLERPAERLAVVMKGGRIFPALPDAPDSIVPVEHVYATRGGMELEAHVFSPREAGGARSAIVIFHGGGWHMGEPAWAYNPARRFAELGLVAVAVQYRLSGEKNPGVTPLDAMSDARAAIRWVRANAAELGVAPDRVAAYGWSAGAHLAISAAIFTDDEQDEPVRSTPDALIGSSPAVSLHDDGWLARILGDRAKPADISPDVHVRKGMPPTLLLQGRTDSVTPLAGTERFHRAMLEAGNPSRLVVYDGVGHLFTPSTESDRGWPNTDPQISAQAYREMESFLRSLGFIAD